MSYNPIRMPHVIPAAPHLPGYYPGVAEAAWTEAWALGYNAGFYSGAEGKEHERQWLIAQGRIAIAERERNHMGLELERVMMQRDDMAVDLEEAHARRRFNTLMGAVLCALTLIITLAATT